MMLYNSLIFHKNIIYHVSSLVNISFIFFFQLKLWINHKAIKLRPELKCYCYKTVKTNNTELLFKQRSLVDVAKTGDGELGTVPGNEERGTGVWEQVHSSSSPENSKWRTKENKREQRGEM